METINRLKELNKELNEVVSKKREAVTRQQYEEAAALREAELKLIHQIEQELRINDKDFSSAEVVNSVKKNIRDIIPFIEDGDTNLTFALIRKLENDIKLSKIEISDLKSKIEEINSDKANFNDLKSRIEEVLKKF
jgi:hypothetical protein